MRYTWIFIISLFSCCHAAAQAPATIYVSTNKTTHLVFEHPVTYFDYGSSDIGVQSTDQPNIIKLKAAKQSFPETNLTVMTGEDNFYSFIVKSSSNPDQLNYFFKESQAVKFQRTIEESVPATATGETLTIDQASGPDFSELCDRIMEEVVRPTNIGLRKDKIILLLKHIFVAEDKLVLLVSAYNTGNLDYDIEFIKFFIRNKQRLRKTSIQEIELTPIFSHLVPERIASSADNDSFCFVFDQFTLSDDKELVLEIWERNGERNLQMEVPAKNILSATNFE
ncbi:conjugative transposon protein TraN [Parapedobacter sp. 10938]|uniref:conjugative transposon protein TraN n=1 Tax=Parapedobacter flavus TaxID=3110225 RepID=UPI002DB9640B|nr:conjugative transposon protein TraN [Parapedobacter sp. 10938]MEC3881834.1 conjugative transposon protein TraN [Parapedobacter sp. 10938]